MKYIFHPEEDLIPKAIYEAQMVAPCEEVREQWQATIYKDLKANRPSNWREFIRQFGLLP